jgi:flagellar basal-body rod modification protein FlgD
MTETVTGVNNYISVAEASKKAQTTKTEDGLGADAFMQLLLTQLKNQNPLEPLKENEMIVQMAQLNSVQELRSMKTSLQSVDRSNQLLSASNLIGKNVTYSDPDEGVLDGIVKSVSLDETGIFLDIDDQLVPFASILGIQEEGTE